jgi:hypothetical protein
LEGTADSVSGHQGAIDLVDDVRDEGFAELTVDVGIVVDDQDAGHDLFSVLLLRPDGIPAWAELRDKSSVGASPGWKNSSLVGCARRRAGIPLYVKRAKNDGFRGSFRRSRFEAATDARRSRPSATRRLHIWTIDGSADRPTNADADGLGRPAGGPGNRVLS